MQRVVIAALAIACAGCAPKSYLKVDSDDRPTTISRILAVGSGTQAHARTLFSLRQTIWRRTLNLHRNRNPGAGEAVAPERSVFQCANHQLIPPTVAFRSATECC